MHFFVQNARASRHPLHVARANCAAITSRVFVRKLPLKDNRDRLKPTVRMRANTPRFVAWVKRAWTRII